MDFETARNEIATNEDIGRNLRLWRVKRGFTQKELAEKFRASGISLDNNQISLMERGKRDFSLELVNAAAYILDCNPDDLIGRPRNLAVTRNMVTELENALALIKNML